MIHKHKPVAEEKMLKYSPENTICEVLRKIYRSTEDQSIRLNCRIATAMAKSMNKKLKEYNQKWADGFFDRNKDLKRAGKNELLGQSLE